MGVYIGIMENKMRGSQGCKVLSGHGGDGVGGSEAFSL